jgi:acyl dehydratase
VALDQSLVGTTLPATAAYQVGREKIREFALAIGEGDSVCLDLEAARAAGHPDVIAPPTFTITFVLPAIETFLRDPDLGWDYGRMVHAEQAVTQHRPIHGGDELSTTIHVEDLRTRAGSHLLTLRSEVADAAGEPVATCRTVLVTSAGEAS